MDIGTGVRACIGVLTREECGDASRLPSGPAVDWSSSYSLEQRSLQRLPTTFRTTFSAYNPPFSSPPSLLFPVLFKSLISVPNCLHEFLSGTQISTQAFMYSTSQKLSPYIECWRTCNDLANGGNRIVGDAVFAVFVFRNLLAKFDAMFISFTYEIMDRYE